MQQARIRLGVAGSLLMIWAAMGVFGAITSAVNHAWGVEKQPSYFKHKLMSFIMLVAASLLLLGGLLLVSAINVDRGDAGSRSSLVRTPAARAAALRGQVGQHDRCSSWSSA